MDDLRILHLSDIHYPGKSEADIKIVLGALIARLGLIERKPDIAIFSGDLVYRGSEKSQFVAAKKHFLDQVRLACGLDETKLFLCPGNHDINRPVVEKSGYIETGLLKTLTDRSAINEFIDNHWELPVTPAPPPFQRLQEFYEAIWSSPNSSTRLTNLFLSAHELRISGRRVGIACFNTAWRTTGLPNNVDRGNLILGERVVDHAVRILDGSDFRIAVFHHPLDWLQSSDEAAVDSRLQSEFDLLLCGHIHKTMPTYRATTHGNAVLSQAGCLYSSRDYFNGFSFIDISATQTEATIFVEEYSDDRREFDLATRVVSGGRIQYPLVEASQRKSQVLPNLLRKAKPIIKRLATDHITLDKTASGVFDIETHFVCPPMREGISSALSDHVADLSEKEGEQFLRDVLVEPRSFVVTGKSESGKTTIANFIAVKVSEGICDCLRLPLIGRFRDLQKGDRTLWRVARPYATEVGDGTINREVVENQPIMMILDDVDALDGERMEILKKCVEQSPNVRWCLLARNPLAGVAANHTLENVLPQFRNLTILELDRRSIRILAANYAEKDRETEDADDAFRTLMEQIQRTGLPRNGYIVSLMIWALQNKSRGEILNEAVLLQNLIDYVLGRMDYTGALRKEFDFQSKTTVLQSFAYHLKAGGAALSKNDSVHFVIDFLSQKGLRYDASEILNGFIKCGLLQEIGGEVSFRHGRFQEFFVAGYLRDNPDALKAALRGQEWLRFARELDLYTGRFRHESQFLDFAKAVLEKMDIPAPALSPVAADDYLSVGHVVDLTNRQLETMRNERMTSDKIDKLFDKTERRMDEKRTIEKTRAQADGRPTTSHKTINFYTALGMYSEFIRNLEFADKELKRTHLSLSLGYWELVLRGWLSVLKEAIPHVLQDMSTERQSSNSVAPNTKKRGTSPEDWAKLVLTVESVFKYAMPTVVAETAYRSLGSEKLIDFFDEIIESDESASLRKLICSFILLELSPERAIDRISELVESQGVERWFLAIVTQRLHTYYSTRPLPKKVATKFEGLVADIQLKLSDKPTKKNVKGLFLTEIKKHAFKEKPKG